VGALAVGRVNVAELDAVTLDAYGTLVTLVDPIPALAEALRERGAERPLESVSAGFRAEVVHYQAHASEGHDEAGLAQLQEECAQVFLDEAGADLGAVAFAPVFAGAMHFEVLPRVRESLERLRALGLELGVVANWDLTLHKLLADVRLASYFKVIVHAAAKPAPHGFHRAIRQLGVDPARVVHIGDDDADEAAARRAGVRFLPAPLPHAIAMLT
jgi:FMN phosphatase YigB (HAD superfamily)